MSNIHRRVEALEERQRSYAASQEQSGCFGASRKLSAVLDELARLRASSATHTRAGKLVQGEDISRQILGENYTKEQLVELAASRAADAGLIEHDEVSGVVAAMVGGGR